MLGFAYYLLGRYLDALPHLQEAASRAPNHGHSRRYLAATYAQLGQLDKAKGEATEALRIEPWFTISQGIFARSASALRMPNISAKGSARRDFRSDDTLPGRADRTYTLRTCGGQLLSFRHGDARE